MFASGNSGCLHDMLIPSHFFDFIVDRDIERSELDGLSETEFLFS